jgi:hypothetical protein
MRLRYVAGMVETEIVPAPSPWWFSAWMTPATVAETLEHAGLGLCDRAEADEDDRRALMIRFGASIRSQCLPRDGRAPSGDL